MKKIKIVAIEITKQTEDLRPDGVLKGGKKKVFEPGHHIVGYAEVVEPFIKQGVAKVLNENPLLKKVKEK